MSRDQHVLELRPLVAGDAEQLADWGMDREFCAVAGWDEGDRGENLRFHADLIERNRDANSRLAITDGNQLIGYVDFTPDNAGSCELGIAIGPSERWGHGYGRAAIALAVGHARRRYAARRLWARTHETNIRARRMLTGAGFIEVGSEGTEEYRGESVAIIRYELPGRP